MDQPGPLLIVAGIMGAAIGLVATYFFAIRILRRCPPMSPLPVQTMFTYCTLFTVGIALLSTRASLLVPFGLVFAFVGIAIFLPETIAIRFVGLFLLLLCVAILSVLKQLKGDSPIYRPQQLTLFSAGTFTVLWGFGVLFAWRRRSQGRTAGSN
jgi:hypothetical protein